MEHGLGFDVDCKHEAGDKDYLRNILNFNSEEYNHNIQNHNVTMYVTFLLYGGTERIDFNARGSYDGFTSCFYTLLRYTTIPTS